MKKNLTTVKNILMGVLAATAMTMASCSDDYEDFNAPKNEVSQAFSANDPLGIGYNTLTANVDELGETMLPVNTNRISITNTNGNMSYSVVSANGKTFIRPSYNGKGGETDIVTIKHMDSNAQKSVFVTINSNACQLVSRAAADVDKKAQKVINTLANGIIPGKAAPEVKANNQVFDVDAMAKFYTEAKGSFLKVDPAPYSNYFFRKAKDHNEHVQKEAKAVGFDLAIPLGGVNFGFGGSFSKSSSTHTVREKETATYGWVERTVVGCMNNDFLLTMLDEEYEGKEQTLKDLVSSMADAIMAKDGNYNRQDLENDIRLALAYQKVMYEPLNNALNNNSNNTSSAFSKYTGHERDLISSYGMYVSPTCQLGGIAQSTMTKNSSSSEIGFEWAMKMKAECNSNTTIKSSETTENKDDKLGKVVKKVIESNPTAAQFKLSVDKSSSVQDILEAMQLETETKCWGGVGTNDIDKWTFDTNNPDQWVCISYASPSESSDNYYSEEKGTNLIALWRLCLDPERRAALRQLTEPDADKKIPYFDYVKTEGRHLVIADVQLKVFKKDVNEKDVLPYYAQDHRKTGSKKHLYIPLRNNENGLAGTQSIVSLGRQDLLLRESNGFVGSYDPALIDYTMVPFVAYEWVYDNDLGKDYTGITSINFGTANGEETVCSERTFKMIHGCPAMDPDGSQHLLLTYAKDNTPINERIKAVGFQYTKNVDKAKRGQVFASSLGTELNGNHDTSAEYAKHWGGNDFLNSNVKEGTHIFRGIWCSWYTLAISKNSYQTKKTIYPCASTKDVTYDITQMINEALQGEK